MQMRLLVSSATIAVGCLICTLAVAATQKKIPSLGSRTATCRADCKTGGTHGLYRAYNTADPNLISPEGRKLYAECVRLCVGPLPTVYIWRPIIDTGGSVFGKSKADCMTCHGPGKPKRFWAGVNTLPDALKRDNSSKY